MELNVHPTKLINQAGTTFFEIASKTKVNIFGNLGIGTDIPLTNFHVENVAFNDKIIQIPTASNIYNYRNINNIYSLVPTGSIIIYPIENTTYLNNLQQQGWYECNGQTLLGSNFPVLSKVIAGRFGNPNPVNTYITIPDFRDIVGIGSTVVGYISPADNPLYSSPSNLYSNTIINTINPGYTIPLSYNNIPSHKHYVNTTSDPIAVGAGTHTHNYEKPNSKANFQGTPGRTVRNTPDYTTQTSSTTAPDSSSGKFSLHNHGNFYSDNSGNSSIVNLVNGTFSKGPTLSADPITIRQASISMIYLLKCL